MVHPVVRVNGNKPSLPDATAPIQVSVVIPVLNETENVSEMCRRLRQVLSACSESFEIIFVAGGSKDGTEEAVLRERAVDERVKLLWLSRNFGHQEAISAGMDYARGLAVITMDGDLQHPPELLPELLSRWHEGYEIVTTTRTGTADAGIFKETFSRWFYAVLNRLSDLNLKQGSADFRLMDRAAVMALQSLPERSRFLRGMVHWIGFRHIDISYQAEGRRAGSSKYRFLRQLQFALSATISFSAMPLYLIALFGFCLAIISFLYGIQAIIAKLVAAVPILGWSSVFAMVTFMGGVQLISLGLAGAYIAKIYEEVKGRPIYLVRRADGFEPPNRSEPEIPAARSARLPLENE